MFTECHEPMYLLKFMFGSVAFWALRAKSTLKNMRMQVAELVEAWKYSTSMTMKYEADLSKMYMNFTVYQMPKHCSSCGLTFHNWVVFIEAVVLPSVVVITR